MKKTLLFVFSLAAACALLGTVAVRRAATPERPLGPCDIFAEDGVPCISAHSTTRALFKDYNGPLYQVMRLSDRKTLDIGVVKPSPGDPGGYADARAQDRFLKGTTGVITIIYDQGPGGNHLTQAPRGRWSGTALGGCNSLPVADWAPVTVMGHKVYGVFITPGMGLRCYDTRGVAVDDQAEGQYWVIAGNHYNSGCCFDYGNAETDSYDDGDGTMETTYFGAVKAWHSGIGPGPWILTDQENHLVGSDVDKPTSPLENVPTITWRFVTATADGEPHHWRMMGGNAQEGPLTTFFDGRRIQNERSSYDPMRKQGAILLGNGGDNSTSSQGTFYEGAITTAGTFPSAETMQKVQENIVSARYAECSLVIADPEKIDAPNHLQTFVPGGKEEVSVKFTNVYGKDLQLQSIRINAPGGWKVKPLVDSHSDIVPSGESYIARFEVTAPRREFEGDLVATARWRGGEVSTSEKVRCAPAIKINEFCIDGAEHPDDSYIELYNAGKESLDISGWEVLHHPINLPLFSTVKIPKGTVLEAGGHYLLGLAASGLSAPVKAGSTVLYLRSAEGLEPGAEIIVGTGKSAEKHTVKAVPGLKKALLPTMVWQPLPDGSVTIPAGATNIPLCNTTGISVGDRLALGYGSVFPAAGICKADYEVVTVTAAGSPGRQVYLAYDALPGDTNIKVSSVESISVGDTLRLDIDSQGHGIEKVVVKSIGTASQKKPFHGPMSLEEAGTGLELEQPLRYAHSANMPLAMRGTGISFEPATKHVHVSNDIVLPLTCTVELEEALTNDHSTDEPVICAGAESGFAGKPDQWYGGPAFYKRGSARDIQEHILRPGGKGPVTGGSIILQSAKGTVADALNYGFVVEPWASEGNHAHSGTTLEMRGNRVILFPLCETPKGVELNYPGISYSRFPDGADSDDNMADFRVTTPTPGSENRIQ